jgi:pimeloyl-ACP methyl ester carboxylesterase
MLSSHTVHSSGLSWGHMERQPSPATPTNAAKSFRRLRWIALLAAAIVLLLATSGISYQAIKAREDARRFHSEGKLVDVGGYKLNIDCTGKGSPTVVLESGVEAPARGWGLVQPGIANFTRVCSYDRAGYGWSDPGPMPRKLSQIVLELHTLLQNAGERPPYILVGHSFGKGSVVLYNKLYPNDVAGMVLAEGGPDKLRLPASIMALSEADLRRRQRRRMFASALYFFGISRFLARKDIEGAGEPTYDQEWYYDAIQPKFIQATTSELENLLSGDSEAELADAPTLGDKPLVVLIAGKGMWGLPLTSQDWVDLRKTWVDGQIQWRSVSPGKVSGLSSPIAPTRFQMNNPKQL